MAAGCEVPGGKGESLEKLRNHQATTRAACRVRGCRPQNFCSACNNVHASFGSQAQLLLLTELFWIVQARSPPCSLKSVAHSSCWPLMGTPLPDIWRKQKELQVSRGWHPRPRRAARVLAWLSLIFRIFRHFPSPLRGWSAPPPGTRTPPMQFLERYKYLTRGDAARCPGTALWTSGDQVLEV